MAIYPSCTETEVNYWAVDKEFAIRQPHEDDDDCELILLNKHQAQWLVDELTKLIAEAE